MFIKVSRRGQLGDNRELHSLSLIFTFLYIWKFVFKYNIYTFFDFSHTHIYIFNIEKKASRLPNRLEIFVLPFFWQEKSPSPPISRRFLVIL